MSHKPDEFIYVALSPQQVASGQFALVRRRNDVVEEKIWRIGRQARSVRYMEIDYALEMSGAMLPGAEGCEWFLCPVISDWRVLNTPHDATPRTAAAWNPNLDMAEQDRATEPNINFVPTRLNVDGRGLTFEELQNFVHGMRLDPQTPRPQANVTATEEAIIHEALWTRQRRPVYVERVVREWQTIAQQMPTPTGTWMRFDRTEGRIVQEGQEG